MPMHPSLRLAGLLPPLDMAHHLRRTDTAPFREGVTVETPPGYQPKFGHRVGSFVDVGLAEPVEIRETVPAGQRVTIRMSETREHVRTFRSHFSRIIGLDRCKLSIRQHHS